MPDRTINSTIYYYWMYTCSFFPLITRIPARCDAMRCDAMRCDISVAAVAGTARQVLHAWVGRRRLSNQVIKSRRGTCAQTICIKFSVVWIGMVFFARGRGVGDEMGWGGQ